MSMIVMLFVSLIFFMSTSATGYRWSLRRRHTKVTFGSVLGPEEGAAPSSARMLPSRKLRRIPDAGPSNALQRGKIREGGVFSKTRSTRKGEEE